MDYLVTYHINQVSVAIKLLPGHFGQCVCVISLGYSRRFDDPRCLTTHGDAVLTGRDTEMPWTKIPVPLQQQNRDEFQTKSLQVPIWSKCKHTWASMLTMLFMRYLCLLISPCMMPAVAEGKELRLLPAPPTRLGGWILQGLRWGNRWRSGGGELPHSLWLPLGFQALNLSVGQKGQATTWVWNKRREPSNLCMWKTAQIIFKKKNVWRTKLLTTRNGHGKSGWFPIGCEGLYFHAMCKNRISDIGKWVVLWRFSHKFEHPKSTPYYFSLPLVLLVTHVSTSLWDLCLWLSSILAMHRQVTQYTDRRHKRSKWTSGCRCRLGNLGKKTFRHTEGSNLKGFGHIRYIPPLLPSLPSLCNSSTTAVTSGRLRSGCA